MLTSLPSSCAVVMKSGNLNFLEPSGPVQACNGTDLPFYNSTGHCFKKLCARFMNLVIAMLAEDVRRCVMCRGTVVGDQYLFRFLSSRVSCNLN